MTEAEFIARAIHEKSQMLILVFYPGINSPKQYTWDDMLPAEKSRTISTIDSLILSDTIIPGPEAKRAETL